MRTLAFLVAITAIPAVALGANLAITGTTPTQYVDNAGMCFGTLVAYPPGIVFTIHVKWWAAGADSVGAPEDSLANLGPGAPYAFFKQVPAGTYRKRGWVTWGSDVGCDTTVTRFVGGKPWHPTMAP